MAKVKKYELSKGKINKELNELFDVVSSLKNKERVKLFFKDLLTDSEQVMLSRRLQIAKLLLKGDTYREIAEKLNVGKTTVKSVDKWLNQGLGGYRAALEKAKKEKRPFDYGDDMNLSFTWLRKRYPAHFWLINMILD